MALHRYLGPFEEEILLAITHLDAEAYGVAIRQKIKERTGACPAVGAIYVTLDRLQQKGLVESRLGTPTPVRGGRAKRYFSLTLAGREALQRRERLWENFRTSTADRM
jgi:DNA-binding PadR family transcriptional regulator